MSFLKHVSVTLNSQVHSLAKATILALLTSINANAANVEVAGGYIVASRYLDWNHPQRVTYVMGLVDGIRISAVLDASGSRYKKAISCFDGMNGNQITAIMDKWLNNNPEQWNISLNHAFISMMYKTCNL